MVCGRPCNGKLKYITLTDAKKDSMRVKVVQHHHHHEEKILACFFYFFCFLRLVMYYIEVLTNWRTTKNELSVVIVGQEIASAVPKLNSCAGITRRSVSKCSALQ
jgi:hypothetical protein